MTPDSRLSVAAPDARQEARVTGHPAARTRVLFYIKNLNGGGAERAVVDLVNSLDRGAFEPKLLLGSRTGEYLDLIDDEDLLNPDYAPPDNVRKLVRRAAGAFWARWINSRLDRSVRNEQARRRIQGWVVSNQVHRLRWAIRSYRPHVVVSSLMETGSLHVHIAREARLRGTPRYRWVAVEQNNTKKRFEAWYDPEELPLWLVLTARLFRAADAVVAVSAGVKRGLIQHYGVAARNIAVIPNHVDNEAVANTGRLKRDRPFILAAGRLHYQKNFHALIEAYASIADRVSEDLIIVGEGEDRESLEEEVRAAGLEGRVLLPGFQDDLWSYMKGASCLVLSSRFEGLPLTLLEAMAAGCPVVSFDADFGPGEIITDGVNGFLVPQGETHALAGSILKVLGDEALAERFREAGRSTARDFDRASMVSRYEALFRSLVSV